MKTIFSKNSCGLALLVALSLLSPAAVVQAETLADVENLGDTLVFHPVVEFSQLILTVTGPCSFEYRQVVSKGELFFRLDETTIDGVYTYHLSREEAVDPGIVKILLEARQADDPEVPKQLCRDGKLPGPPASQSEGFLVAQRQIIYDPETIEPPRKRLNSASAPVNGNGGGVRGLSDPGIVSVSSADFVINDDLIVDGSACIGFDCVNGESFGFDTIRLKENNLRIKFDDTSVAASFPRNDWQLTANDSANGGASKFSIDDISGARTPFTVEANARSHSLYVDDGGRIGSRTSTPSVEIHTIDGDTPTLRLHQDGSSGFTPQTWDVAGNETNFFVRDVTNGSSLPLRIRPGAPSSAIFIDTDGDLGFGTSAPASGAGMQLVSTAAENLWITNPSPGTIWEESDGSQEVVNALLNNSIFRIIGFDSGLTEVAAGVSVDLGDANVGINCNDGGTLDLTVGDGDSCAGTFSGFNAGDAALTSSSSRSIKENLQEVAAPDILHQINAIDVYTYDFIDGPQDRMGLMAEDFHEVFGRGSDRLINNGEVQMALWLAVQQLISANQDLLEDNQDLQERVRKLEMSAGDLGR